MSRFFVTLTTALAAAVFALVPVSATAQDYPDRPVSLMVAYGAGGATDFQARIVTMVSANEDFLGQPTVIVNRPGAGGRVGWNWMANEAEADGYQLGAYNVPHFIAQSIKGGVDYSIDTFEPVANWGADPAVVVVAADSEFDDMTDLVAYMEENPGKLTVSGAGLFVGHHIAALQIEDATGAEMAYIPNDQGGAAAMKAVIAGDVMAGINNLSDAYRAREAGQVKIIGVADVERNEQFLPDVPTLMEQGIEVDDSSVNFRGFMVPKGTPEDQIEFLAARIPKMLEHPRVQSRMEAGGSPMRIMTREEVQEMWTKRQDYLEDLLAGL